MYIGYNVNKINEVMNEVTVACTTFANKVDEKFEGFKTVIRKEWIGPDQQDFEEELIKRLNKLLNDTKDLSLNTCQNVYNLGCAWADFQDKNTIDGQSTGTASKLKSALTRPKAPTIDNIVYSKITFDPSQNLGLLNESSLTTLETGLSTFVTDIKRDAKTLFDEIETQNAFFGSSQQNSVKSYIEKVGETIGIIESCIKDFNEAMGKLTGGSYGNADSDVSSEISKLNSDLEKGVGNYGQTRWN